MKVLFKEFITVWTRGLVSWLSRKFDSISIDLTPVEEKLDAIGGKIGTPAEGQPTTLFGAISAGGSGGGDDAHNLAAFFNITPPVPNAVPMTQQEVEDDLDELWNLIITQ